MPQAIGATALLLALTRCSLAQSVVSSATVLLPHATEGLWASVITEAASATEYFIACSSAWDNPQDCEAPFTGITLTAKPSGVVSVELCSTSYHCSHNEDGAVCQTRTPADSSEKALIIEPSETAEWVTTLGVIEPAPIIELRAEVQRSPQDGGGGSSGGGGGGGGGGGW
jgi:uncharacterized membrane protein YgcG